MWRRSMDDYFVYFNSERKLRMHIERNDDPTNTYFFIDATGKLITLGQYNVMKSTDGKIDMVNMKENQSFYNSRCNNSKNTYLTEDQAALFLAATYDFYTNNDEYKTNVSQFMALDFIHSSRLSETEYAKFMIDVKYIGIDRNTIAPRTDKNNVDINASYNLAMTFRKFGLGIDSRSPTYGVITEDGTGTKSLFPYFSRVSGHQDHIHLQGSIIRYNITPK